MDQYLIDFRRDMMTRFWYLRVIPLQLYSMQPNFSSPCIIGRKIENKHQNTEKFGRFSKAVFHSDVETMQD